MAKRKTNTASHSLARRSVRVHGGFRENDFRAVIAVDDQAVGDSPVDVLAKS